MAIVYLHRKPCNNEIFYVGIGNSKIRSQRNEGRNTHWTRVFNKYGKYVEIIAENISVEDARELEIFLISQIGLVNLCNQTLGGEGFFGGKHTKESKLKMSLANKGRKHSEETRAKISKAHMGHSNYLKSQSKEARIKIGNASRGGKNANAKKVVNLITKKEYDCLADACRELKLNYKKVSCHISGRTKKNKYEYLKYK